MRKDCRRGAAANREIRGSRQAFTAGPEPIASLFVWQTPLVPLLLRAVRLPFGKPWALRPGSGYFGTSLASMPGCLKSSWLCAAKASWGLWGRGHAARCVNCRVPWRTGTSWPPRSQTLRAGLPSHLAIVCLQKKPPGNCTKGLFMLKLLENGWPGRRARARPPPAAQLAPSQPHAGRYQQRGAAIEGHGGRGLRCGAAGGGRLGVGE